MFQVVGVFAESECALIVERSRPLWRKRAVRTSASAGRQPPAADKEAVLQRLLTAGTAIAKTA
jgi:DNA invertase Pin-like site-specific DNA recombinase